MSELTENKCRSILVPLDGSQLAEHALPLAAGLARSHGAALHLVRVYVPVAGLYGERALPYDETLDRELMQQSRNYLEEVATRLAAAGCAPASSTLLEGLVALSISEHAAAVGADLIVMTNRGRGPVARFWLGSVADEMVRHASTPILFARTQPSIADLSSVIRFQRVLIPLDGSTLAERVLEPVLTLDVKPDQSRYTLLRIVTSIPEFSYGPAGGKFTGLDASLKRFQELEKEELGRAHAYILRIAKMMREHQLNVDTRVIQHAKPAEAILEDARVHDVDLIALATHGWGGLKRLMLGSIADKLLRGAESAVLVYRPADQAMSSTH